MARKSSEDGHCIPLLYLLSRSDVQRENQDLNGKSQVSLWVDHYIPVGLSPVDCASGGAGILAAYEIMAIAATNQPDAPLWQSQAPR
jgi:hypothetical protein